MPDLAQARKQIVERFGVVNKCRKGSIAQNKFAYRLAPCDPTLMMFQVTEKCLQIIIGGRYIRDTITREQTPPTMTDGFRDVCNNRGMMGLFLGLLGQAIQKFRDGIFDLAGSSGATVFIAPFKLTV